MIERSAAGTTDDGPQASPSAEPNQPVATERAVILASSTLPLLVWLSPAFPVGSFAYSHALEWVTGTGAIHDLATAQAWLRDLLGHGGLRNDAIVLAAAWRASQERQGANLAETNQLALALAGSRERYLETTAQGNAFRLMIGAAWTGAADQQRPAAIEGDVAFPVAVAIAAADHGMELRPVLEAFLLSAVSNMTSALVRLSAIGQTDGQRLICGLLADVEGVADAAMASTCDDVGVCAFQSDIASLRHETQYTRLFRT